MKRTDLLALTPDDLIALANRGVVKRAQRELERGTVTVTVSVGADGAVTAVASDTTTCSIPSAATLADSTCDCSASSASICRHLVRAVLAYQQWAVDHSDEDETTAVALAPWNPGTISDEVLAEHFHTATLKRIRQQFEAGQVVELVRSNKPTARIHTLSCTVRFLVPGDPRYTHCDCADPAPCNHVPLAIWAFRLLADDADSDLVETHHTALPIPHDLLHDIEKSLVDLAELGLAGASATLAARLKRLAQRCDTAGLIWPGDILEEMGQELERYTQHDARFSPPHVAQLIGELLIRCRAIRHEAKVAATAVPAIFVRGSQQDQATKVGTLRLVGLGCGVEVHHHSAVLSAYLQDADSGIVVAVQKEIADPPSDSGEAPASFAQLAASKTMKDFPLATIGARQLLVKGGTRTAHYTFNFGRAPASANPQSYEWQNLRAPVLAEDFAEIRARRQVIPPSCLRPRRVGENLFVCALAGVDQVVFHEATQEVTAVVHDQAGNQAMLVHPYTSRGAAGTEAMLWALTHHADAVKFISGQVRLGHRGLIFQPLGLVVEEDGQRRLIQPWVDGWDGKQVLATAVAPQATPALSLNPRFTYPAQLLDALGDLFLTGFRRVDETTIRQWELLVEEGGGYGFTRLLESVQALAQTLAQKRSQIRWDWQEAVEMALSTAVVARFAQEDI